jgi:hypothetical protein
MVRSLAFSLLMLLGVACAESSPLDPVGPITPTPLPRLDNSVWYAHAANGVAMPAPVRSAANGLVMEEDYVDSLRFHIFADGSWAKSAWHNRFRDGLPSYWAAHHESGRWEIREDGYAFANAEGKELFVLPAPPGAEISLPLSYLANEAPRTFTLRPQAAPGTFHGRWRASTLNGAALPAVYSSELNEEYPEGSLSWSIVIDSANVFLYPNGHYGHRIYYSEYHGEAGQQPTRLFRRFVAIDYGSFSRDGTQLSLSSGWLSGLLKFGSVAENGAGALALNHGLTHGDPPAAFTYLR